MKLSWNKNSKSVSIVPLFSFFTFSLLYSPSSFFNQKTLIYNFYFYLLCFQFTYDFIKGIERRKGEKKKERKKKKVQENERHVSRERGAT